MKRAPLKFKLIVSITLLSVSLMSCSDGGSDFSPLDSASGQGAEGIGRCSIKTLTPANTTDIKVSGALGAISNFTVTPEGTDCQARFYLNGSNTPFHTGSMTASIASSDLLAGANSIRVELIGPIGSDQAEWNLTKNQVPTCSLVTPALPNINATEGSSVSLMVSAGLEAGETPTFTWQLNGASSNRLTRTLETGAISQYAFDTTSLTGVSDIRVQVSDGTDTAQCTYAVNVGADCALIGKLPDVPSLRMASAPNSQLFEATSAATNCIVTWTINGLPVSGTGLTRTLNSSELNTGSNILTATVIASSGTSSQQWVVNKNAPPSCNQSPIGNLAISAGGILNLQSLFSDSDTDPLSWTWGINGSTAAAVAPLLTVVNGVNTTNANFTPTNANLGFNSIGIAVTDGLDTTNCTWSVTVNPACSISAKTPDAAAATIANLGTTVNIFGITPSSESCNVSWTLNGVNLGSSLTLQTLLSSSFLNTPNVLRATVGNATSSEFHEWNISKNQVPTCDTQSPGASGLTLGVSSSQAFSLTVGDPDVGQSYNYTWRMNGSELTAGFLSIDPPAGKTTSATWVPNVGQVGSNILSVLVSDGYDTRTCSWNTTVLPDCVITESNPAAATIKVRNEAAFSSQFVAVPNSTCNVSWTLNGTPVGGGGSILNVLSSELIDTPNTIVATAANAVSSVTRSWTVNKNQLTTCATQNPNPGFTTLIDVTNTETFTGTVTNPDGDPLTFSWLLGGNSSPAFHTQTGDLVGSQILLTPGYGQIGNSQLVSLRVNDGYDTVNCNWTVDIRDPNVAQIISVTPSSNPVILLSDGSVDLSVAASGTGITYQWYVDGDLQPARTLSTETFTFSDLSTPKIYNVRVVVTDSSANTDEYTFNVKRNVRPTISAFAPNEVGVSSYRVSLNGSLGFSVTANDLNGDTLNYDWTLNNTDSPYIVETANSASFDPAGQSLLIGPHILRVTVSDGHESVTQSWNVGVNYFSDECNILLNSASTGANGGKACTLVGNPSIGDGEDVVLDPTLIKARFRFTTEIAPNVFAYTDWDSHVVGVVNASGSPVNYFGKNIENNKMKVVIGYGQRGFNLDASSDEDAFNPITGVSRFKLHSPDTLAFDSSTNILYIADYRNHRVLSLNSSGKVTRVIGLNGGASSTDSSSGTNAPLDSTIGQNTVCRLPAGLTINQEGADKYLYVTCSQLGNGTSQNRSAIKKVNITTYTGQNPASLVTTVGVGRLSDSGNAYLDARSIDGLAATPGDQSILTGATAQVREPNGIFSHDGLIYFTDRGRIRVFNPKATPVTVLGNLDSNREELSTLALAQTFAMRALLLNDESRVSTPILPRYSLLGSNTANQAEYSIPQTNVATGTCAPVAIMIRNGVTRIVAGSTLNTTANISAGAQIYNSLASCMTGGGGTSVAISVPAGRSLTTVWVRADANTSNRTISVTGLSNSSGNITFSAAGAYTATPTVRIQTPLTQDTSDCSPIHMTLTNNTSAPMSTGAVDHSVVIAHNNIGTFYSDATCSTPLDSNRVIFPAASIANATLFYDRKVIALPNHVAAIFGYEQSGFANNNQNLTNNTTYLNFTTSRTGLTVRNLGSAYYSLNNSTRYIAPFGSFSSGGQNFPQAIVYNTNVLNGPHAVFMLNLSESELFTGTDMNIAKLSTRIIAGPNADNTSSGYNGDDQPAIGSSFNGISGLAIRSDNSGVIVSDYDNRRVRFLELGTTTPNIRALIGIGRERMRTNNMNISSTETTLARPFKLELFNNELYFSEYANHRIRKVNLTTGITSVVVGIGSGNVFNDGNDATTEFMRDPRGFKVVAWPNALSPTNHILVYSERCHVRAVNVSGPNIPNFMGRSMLPGKVTTIAGDTSNTNCNTNAASVWTGGTPINTNGMNARFATFGELEDIAYIGGEIYMIDRRFDCLLRVNSSGQLYEVGTGACARGSAVSEEGELSAPPGGRALTRRPIAFYPDSTFQNNYFLMQDYEQATSQLAYINTLASPVSFFAGLVNASGITSYVGRVTRIFDISGTQRPGGLASWSASPGFNSASDLICFSTGEYSQDPNAGVPNGSHNISCASRTIAPGTPSLVAGPANFRSGAPLGREQEGAGRFDITFDAPTGLAFDSDGNLYVADQGNHIIRMIRRWW